MPETTICGFSKEAFLVGARITDCIPSVCLSISLFLSVFVTGLLGNGISCRPLGPVYLFVVCLFRPQLLYDRRRPEIQYAKRFFVEN